MVKLGMVVQDLKISIDILRLSNIPRKPIYCSSCWICSHPRHILLVVVQIATLCPHVLHRLKHCPRASDRWAETSKNRPLSLPTETTSSHNNYPSPYWKKSGKHGRSTATVVHRATRSYLGHSASGLTMRHVWLDHHWQHDGIFQIWVEAAHLQAANFGANLLTFQCSKMHQVYRCRSDLRTKDS